LKQDLDALHTRVDQFVDKRVVHDAGNLVSGRFPSDMPALGGTGAQEPFGLFGRNSGYTVVKPTVLHRPDIERIFRRNEPLVSDAFIRVEYRGYLWAATETQRHLARWQVLARDPGHANDPPPLADTTLRETALLVPARREAYHAVQEGVRRYWVEYLAEALLKTGILQQSVLEHQKLLYHAFEDDIAAFTSAHNEGGDNDLWGPYFAARCQAVDPRDPPYLAQAAANIRAIVADLRATRRRLMADMQAWKTYGAKDGAGTTFSGGIWNHRDEDFGKFINTTFMSERETVTGIKFVLIPSRPFPPLLVPECYDFVWLLADKENALDGDKMLADVRRTYPEAEFANAAIGLNFPLAVARQVSRATVSGAGAAQRP
jgi:hypothetical protein